MGKIMRVLYESPDAAVMKTQFEVNSVGESGSNTCSEFVIDDITSSLRGHFTKKLVSSRFKTYLGGYLFSAIKRSRTRK